MMAASMASRHVARPARPCTAAVRSRAAFPSVSPRLATVGRARSLHASPLQRSSLSAASRSPFSAALRPSSLYRLSTPGSRGYASGPGGPNPQQVLQSFGTPFAQFVHLVARIARIITMSVVGVAVVGLVGYEATHQYVEHVAMPRAPAAGADEWGWNEQLSEESWSGAGTSGTDRRLGLKGRHAVRSAWMSAHWGGGIAPGLVLGGIASGSAGVGRTSQTSIVGARSLHVEDGMMSAMQYLAVALEVARQKGIVLASPEAVRTGQVDADPTALALEAKMAAIKERQGSPAATASAIEGYEKIFAVQASPRAASAADVAHSAKLVRLATKLGDLNASIGQRQEATMWFNKAVQLASVGPGADALSLSVNPNDAIPPHDAATAASAAASGGSGWWSGWLSKGGSAGAARDAAGTPVAPASVAISESLPPSSPTISALAATASTPAAATPALTRSLLSSLISLSALYAQRPTAASGASNAEWEASLTSALHLQTGALKLAQLELERLSRSGAPVAPGSGEQLHALSVRHFSSVLQLHLAETVYALESRFGKKSVSAGGWFGGRGGSSTGSEAKYAYSLTRLDEAGSDSRKVLDALVAAPAVGKKGKAPATADGSASLTPKLSSQWSRDKAGHLDVFAKRLARDATRVQLTAEKLRGLLQRLD